MVLETRTRDEHDRMLSKIQVDPIRCLMICRGCGLEQPFHKEAAIKTRFQLIIQFQRRHADC